MLYLYPDNLVIAAKGRIDKSAPNRIQANGRPENLRRGYAQIAVKQTRVDGLLLPFVCQENCIELVATTRLIYPWHFLQTVCHNPCSGNTAFLGGSRF